MLTKHKISYVPYLLLDYEKVRTRRPYQYWLLLICNLESWWQWNLVWHWWHHTNKAACWQISRRQMSISGWKTKDLFVSGVFESHQCCFYTLGLLQLT